MTFELDPLSPLLLNGDVPMGWSRHRLEEIATISGGTTPSRAEDRYWGGSTHWATPTDLTSRPAGTIEITATAETLTDAAIEETSVRVLPTNSVLMTSRATIGEVGINCVPVATNQGFCNFVPKNGTHSSFLAYWLAGNRKRLERLAGGSTFLELAKRDAREVRIHLPPLPEQRKIAAILSSVDDAIAATRKIIDETKRVKRGLLETLMTRGIGHSRFKKTEVGEIPEEWEVRPLPTLGEDGRPMLKAGPFGSSLKKELYTTDGYKVYGQEQVLARDPWLGDYYIDEERYRTFETCAVQPGDILVTLVGTPGRTLVLKENAEPGIINPRLVRLSPSPSLIDSHYLSLWLESSRVRRRLGSLSQGGTMDVLNSKMLSSLRMPRPPLEEQKAIVRHVHRVENAVSRSTATADRLQALKRGLMQDLLTGRVRVPTD